MLNTSNSSFDIDKISPIRNNNNNSPTQRFNKTNMRNFNHQKITSQHDGNVQLKCAKIIKEIKVNVANCHPKTEKQIRSKSDSNFRIRNLTESVTQRKKHL